MNVKQHHKYSFVYTVIINFTNHSVLDLLPVTLLSKF